MATAAGDAKLDRIGGFLLVLIIVSIIGNGWQLLTGLAPQLAEGATASGAGRLWALTTGAVGLGLSLGLAGRRPWAPDGMVTFWLVGIAVGIVLFPLLVGPSLRQTAAAGIDPVLIGVWGVAFGAVLQGVGIAYLLRSRRVALVYRRAERERLVPGWLQVLPDVATAVVERTGAAGFVVVLALVVTFVTWLVLAAA